LLDFQGKASSRMKNIGLFEITCRSYHGGL